jgi:hypothetical protein
MKINQNQNYMKLAEKNIEVKNHRESAFGLKRKYLELLRMPK